MTLPPGRVVGGIGMTGMVVGSVKAGAMDLELEESTSVDNMSIHVWFVPRFSV